MRKETGLFIAEGKKIIAEILKSKLKIHSLYSTSDYLEEIQPLVKSKPEGFESIEIEESELSKISFLSTPNKALGIVHIPPNDFVPEEIKNRYSLFLDNIRDPGNLGNIIRIADWFGIENIFCSTESVDAFNPKVVQATMGSIARVNVFYTDSIKFLSDIQNVLAKTSEGDFKIYATTLQGKNIYTENFSKNGVIIFGNESEGISEKISHLAQNNIKIPSYGNAESLNVAASAAIVCSLLRKNVKN